MLATPPDGILLVDKPQGISSHRVVSIARRRLGLKKIGHAGTLDPMATGLLLLGAGPSTRLLTHLVGLGKTYTATIRLGVGTDSDDADGTPTSAVGVADADVSDEAIEHAVAAQRGVIDQVPSTVSAIKVDGRRAYDLARKGEEVVLRSRTVTVSRFTVTGRDDHTVTVDGVDVPVVDLDVVVDCSSGTYVRALARDVGAPSGRAPTSPPSDAPPSAPSTWRTRWTSRTSPSTSPRPWHVRRTSRGGCSTSSRSTRLRRRT